MRFLEWDYDNDVVTQYERTGQCNQCGACCTAGLTFTTKPPIKVVSVAEPTEWWLRTDGKGVWNEISHRGDRKYLKLKSFKLNGSRCSCLTRSNKCLLRLFGGWAAIICNAWPLSPKCIEPFPNCGFSFVETGQWTISSLEETNA